MILQQLFCRHNRLLDSDGFNAQRRRRNKGQRSFVAESSTRKEPSCRA